MFAQIRVPWTVKIVLNSWATSHEDIEAETLYVLQLAIKYSEDDSFEGYNIFYGFVQRFFRIWGISASEFNENFEQPNWTVTITGWQIVSPCIAARFPWDVIYGSLNIQ